MEGPPLGPGGEDITWPDQVALWGRKASSTRKIKPQTSNPWPLAVLLHTVSAPNKRQEPGWANPPTLVWSPDQEEHLRAAWQGDAIRTTDVPDLHAGPVTHARPAATLAVAQRGQQNPQWVVCMLSPADADIAVCDPERQPGPEAVIRVADCARVIVKALREGEHHALLLQVRLKDNAKAAKPGVWPAAARPCRPRAPAGGPDHGIPLATGFPRPAMEGQAQPPNRRHALARVAAGRRTARRRPRSWTRARDARARCVGPGPRAGATHGSAGQPALRSGAGGRHPKVGAASPGTGGHGANEMPPMCRQVLHKWGDARTAGVARGACRRPSGRQGGGLPHPPGEGTEIPVARPVRPAPGRPRRRRPERPLELAVQPIKGRSPWDWPPWPPCGPPWEQAPHTPWPQHTQESWLLQRTPRRRRYGTADSRRTRRKTPSGSSP